MVVSVLFSFYLENFANLDATYGTLGALNGLMVWVSISVIVLIVGAEINAELEHQTRKNSTTGVPKPMESAAHSLLTPLVKQPATAVGD